MRKILLTESQIKLLTEEINKNDMIQNLIFSDPSNISFEVSNEVPFGISVSRNLFRLTPVINGKEYGSDFINLLAEEVKIYNNVIYQLHINVNNELRRLGIAEKLYIAFILQGYPVCSLFKNRVSTFYDENGSKVSGDDAISNLWKKIQTNPLIHTEDIQYNGKVIGILAYKNDQLQLNESVLVNENKITDAIFYGCNTFKDYASRIMHIAETGAIIALSVYIQTIKEIPVGSSAEKQNLLDSVENVINNNNKNTPTIKYADEVSCPISFTLSNDGIEHLKQYENFSDTAYYATEYEKKQGIRTIGWGHVIRHNDPDWLKTAKRITKKQADEIFINDLNIFIKEYNKAVSRLPKYLQNPSLYSQGFIDMGISILYNSGYGNFVGSPFYKTWKKCGIDSDTGKIKKEDYDYTISKIKYSCITQDNKEVPGLKVRRNKECLIAQNR